MIKGVNFYYFLDNNIGIGLSERDEGGGNTVMRSGDSFYISLDSSTLFVWR